MTKRERCEIMRYAGMIEGICCTFDFDGMEYETEEDLCYMTSLRNKLIDIAQDLRAIAEEFDFDVSKFRIFDNDAPEGGDA